MYLYLSYCVFYKSDFHMQVYFPQCKAFHLHSFGSGVLGNLPVGAGHTAERGAPCISTAGQAGGEMLEGTVLSPGQSGHYMSFRSR